MAYHEGDTNKSRIEEVITENIKEQDLISKRFEKLCLKNWKKEEYEAQGIRSEKKQQKISTSAKTSQIACLKATHAINVKPKRSIKINLAKDLDIEYKEVKKWFLLENIRNSYKNAQ